MKQLEVKTRFYSKVAVPGTPNGCWEWTGAKDKTGYGRFKINGKAEMSHRVSHMIFIGDIPEGYDIDHLCRNTGCVNPEHIEAVTRQENYLRGLGPSLAKQREPCNKFKTHCVNGHPRTVENTCFDEKRNAKRCRICKNNQMKEYRRKRLNQQ